MKIFLLIILNMLLPVVYGLGQVSDDTYGENREMYRKFIVPKNDSLILKSDTSLTSLLDSIKSGKILRINGRSRDLFNPRLNQDIIVLDPRPSLDNMPIVDVAKPGVLYHLKIAKIPKFKSLPKERIKPFK